MKIDRLFLFDSLAALALILLATGATFFMPESVLFYVRVNPKPHRLILSSLMFLVICYFGLLKFKFKRLDESLIVRAFSNPGFSPYFWVWAIYALIGSIFALSSWMRHQVFRSSFDFAIFAQAIWNTWEGHFLYSSIKGGINLLGDHFSPILVMLAPFYGLTREPGIILIIQAFVACSSVFPIYLIAKRIHNDHRIALAFVCSFALYLPFRNAVRFDFHPELLGDPLILWAFYFILENKLGLASLFLALVLTTKEIASAPVAMLAIYSFIFQRKKLFGIFWFTISVTWLLLVVKVIIPGLMKGEQYFYLRGNYLYWFELGLPAFLHHLFQGSTLTYLKKIFLPVGLLSFLSPSTFILTFPVLFQNLATRNTACRSIFFQYTTFLTPFVFVSAIYGLKNTSQMLVRFFKLNFEMAGSVAVFFLLSASLLMTGVSEIHVIREFQRRNNEHLAYVRDFLKHVPTDVSVRTHEFFAPHVSNRLELHIYENGNIKEGGSPKALNADLVILDRDLLGNDYQNKIKDLLRQNYLVQFERDGLYLLSKKRIDFQK